MFNCLTGTGVTGTKPGFLTNKIFHKRHSFDRTVFIQGGILLLQKLSIPNQSNFRTRQESLDTSFLLIFYYTMNRKTPNLLC